MKFEAPIPGESLTGSPKKFPWERPPEIEDPEDAVEFYLDKLADEDTLEVFMDFLEEGMTVKALTEGIIRISVSRGLHTIDVGLLVAPIVHERLKTAADFLGIEYDEGLEDKEAKEEYRKASRLAKIRRKLDKISLTSEEEDLEEEASEMFTPDVEEGEEEEALLGGEEEEEPMEAPKGFMQRGM